MSRFVLDTSAYSHFQRGDAQVVELIDGAEWLGFPWIVVGELELGFQLGLPDRVAANRALLREFLDNAVVAALGLDHDVGKVYAEIVVALRRTGNPLPTNDIWIAAIAVRHGGTVLTYDQHFARIQRVGSVVLAPA